MKKISCLLIAMCLALSNYVIPVQAQEESNPKVVYLDLSDREYTDEEIDEKIVEELDRRVNKTRDSGYSYRYTQQIKLYDTGSASTSYKLIGIHKSLDWEQRDSVTLSTSASFSTGYTYSDITSTYTITDTVSSTYSFDDSFPSHLGIFARLQTYKYLVEKIDKYSNTVVDYWTENVMINFDDDVRKIYKQSDSSIKYTYGSSNYTAQTLKSSLTGAATSDSDFSTAYSYHFSD